MIFYSTGAEWTFFDPNHGTFTNHGLPAKEGDLSLFFRKLFVDYALRDYNIQQIEPYYLDSQASIMNALE